VVGESLSTGELAESNEEVQTNAAIHNEDCYCSEWIHKIKLEDMDESDNLIYSVVAI
jgi:glycine cleavage system H lipoate-binding protein